MDNNNNILERNRTLFLIYTLVKLALFIWYVIMMCYDVIIIWYAIRNILMFI